MYHMRRPQIPPAIAVGTVEAPPSPGKSSDQAVDTVDPPVELAKATGLVAPPLPQSKTLPNTVPPPPAVAAASTGIGRRFGTPYRPVEQGLVERKHK